MAVADRMYARALHEAAKERGRLDQVRGELGDFVETMREVPELRALLRNPQLDPRAKVAALEGLLGGADELVRNFLLLVTERGRSGDIEDIQRELERLASVEAGQLSVQLTTAFELSDEQARSIVAQIEQASGRKVEATRKADPDLLGGIVVQAGSLRLDASLQGRLNRLRREIVQRGYAA